METFDDKAVLVSGGGSGIGRCAALAFAERGASVCVLGRREEKLLETLGLMGDARTRGWHEVCDVSDRDSVVRATGSAIAHLGKVDILVNAAGTSGEFDVGDASGGFGEWHREMGVNLDGSAYLCAELIPAMVERGWGRVINISSVNALVTSKTVARHPYNASKAGICGLTRGLSSTYAARGVTVNALCPGLFETELTEGFFGNAFALSTFNRQIPAGRPGSLAEIAAPILFLASEGASYVTGQCIAVDGGMSTGSFI